MNARPNESQYATEIPRSERQHPVIELIRSFDVQFAMKTYPKNPPRCSADDVSDTSTGVMPVKAGH